ncbi:MAG TPA: hypothetical protein VJP58_09230 [Candidatus Nitrosocosmicus sp.]|nr:hypothetical protein [Candidatus Nitrosocosmicus sp.]
MFKFKYTKKTALLIVAVFATVMIMGPSISGINSVQAKQKYKDWEDCRDDHSKNWCKNYFRHHNGDDDNNGNRASQAIGQSQSSSQNSQCVSGGSTSASCNNLNIQNQKNSGNNALAQDGNGKGGNKASQGIGQSQSSSQNSQVVSGGNTVGSGNNFNFQNQVNTGNNALAQR